NPYALVGKGLRDAGAGGRLGIEERVIFAFSDGIARANPGLSIGAATPVTAGCRARKSPSELALMRLANSVTLEAYEAAWKSAHDGMTNQQLEELIKEGFAGLGFPAGGVSVQVG